MLSYSFQASSSLHCSWDSICLVLFYFEYFHQNTIKIIKFKQFYPLLRGYCYLNFQLYSDLCDIVVTGSCIDYWSLLLSEGASFLRGPGLLCGLHFIDAQYSSLACVGQTQKDTIVIFLNFHHT